MISDQNQQVKSFKFGFRERNWKGLEIFGFEFEKLSERESENFQVYVGKDGLMLLV